MLHRYGVDHESLGHFPGRADFRVGSTPPFTRLVPQLSDRLMSFVSASSQPRHLHRVQRVRDPEAGKHNPTPAHAGVSRSHDAACLLLNPGDPAIPSGARRRAAASRLTARAPGPVWGVGVVVWGRGRAAAGTGWPDCGGDDPSGAAIVPGGCAGGDFCGGRAGVSGCASGARKAAPGAGCGTALGRPRLPCVEAPAR